MEFLNEKQQNIIEFLKDNEARTLEFVHIGVKYKTLLVKVQMRDGFDFVYAIEEYQYFEGADFIPNMKEAEFVAAIDRDNGDIINMSGGLAIIFHRLTPEQRNILQIVEIDDINMRFNACLDAALEELAETIDDKMLESEKETAAFSAGDRAQNNYFYGETEPKHKTYAMQDERVLLSFIARPKETLENYIKQRREHIMRELIWDKAVKYEIDKKLKEIESSAEYAGLRVAKGIKDIIPCRALEIMVHYAAQSGEILKFKMDAGELRRKPWKPCGDMGWHYSSSGISLRAERVDFREAEGARAEVLVERIVKIEYRGKTLWEAERGEK